MKWGNTPLDEKGWIYFFSSSSFSVQVSPLATASLVKIEFGHGNSLSKGTGIIEHSYPHIITIMTFNPQNGEKSLSSWVFFFPEEHMWKEKGAGWNNNREKTTRVYYGIYSFYKLAHRPGNVAPLNQTSRRISVTSGIIYLCIIMLSVAI